MVIQDVMKNGGPRIFIMISYFTKFGEQTAHFNALLQNNSEIFSGFVFKPMPA